MIVAFEGIDGAGKTTLAPRVAAILQHHGIDARFAAKRAPGISDNFAKEQLNIISECLWGVPHDARLDSLGTPYWIYLNAAYFSGIYAALSRQQQPYQVTIFDNWINKFIARISARGEFRGDELETILALVPQPDLVVLLDVEPDVAAQRKLTASELEQGVLFNGQLDFVGYQGLIRDHLLAQARQRDWPVVVAGARQLDAIAAETAQLIYHRIIHLSRASHDGGS
jgi:thymidylate kinase